VQQQGLKQASRMQHTRVLIAPKLALLKGMHVQIRRQTQQMPVCSGSVLTGISATYQLLVLTFAPMSACPVCCDCTLKHCV
jgi:hypothetical protein